MRKKDKSFRVIIIGVIMIFGAILLNSLLFLVGGIFMGISPTVTPILIFLGILFVILGALMENQVKRTP